MQALWHLHEDAGLDAAGLIVGPDIQFAGDADGGADADGGDGINNGDGD